MLVVDDDLLTSLKEVENVVHCALALAVPHHEAVVCCFAHREVLGRVEFEIPLRPVNFDGLGLPVCDVVAGRFAREEHQDVRVLTVGEEFLNRFVCAIRVTDDDLKSFRHHLLGASSHLLVQATEPARTTEKDFLHRRTRVLVKAKAKSLPT